MNNNQVQAKVSAKEAARAHRAVAEAVKYGEIKKENCSKCGTSKSVVAHHEDYSKPLDVTWLCQTHHRNRHVEIGQPLMESELKWDVVKLDIDLVNLLREHKENTGIPISVAIKQAVELYLAKKSKR